ncbi:condensation domain-containing protein [Nonomuraea rhodomycinica]|uniref:condensation domain-containing protein n=1 Tax=Nonomuraea rhodomycinica TaxID=1712872 RepID=UPI0028B0A12E|nr:condensation domain-containing protein [Nonomuraea rhodomycinica]
MRTANLCWGQRYIWLRVHQLPPRHQHETHIVLTLDVPAGVTPAHCRAMLTHLARRHETLRTTYHLDAGEPGTGPVQRVHPPGALGVREVTVERDGTPAPAEVVDELSTRPFDLAGEWPLRAAVITAGGVAKRVVMVLNHLAVDVWTLGELKRELRTQGAALAARRPATVMPVRHQPSDLARHETSADATVVAARSIAYWQEEVAALPADPYATRRRSILTKDEPPARHASLTSPALLGATRRIAARYGVWPSLVHLAAHTALTAAYTGLESVSHLSFVSNRESHPYPDVLTCMFSPTLVRVDCSGDPAFGDLLGRVAAAFARAKEHSYLPYDEVVELVSREGSRRGREVLLGAEVNFIKQRSKDYGGRRTALTWHPVPEAWAHAGSEAYLRVDEWRDAVAVSLQAASPVMDAAAVEAFLRGHEALILACDADPEGGPRLGDVARLAALPTPTALAAHAPTGPSTLTAHAPAGPLPAWDGRDGEEAARALSAAVRLVNGLPRLDLSDSYTLAGGRALRIPRVLAELRERGWEGLTLRQLAGPVPLGVLAGRLVPTRPLAERHRPSDLTRLGVKP